MGHSRGEKVNILVMMDAFSNFTVAVIKPNHQVKTVAQSLVDKWFYTSGIPFGIHNERGKPFDNNIIHYLCSIYRVKQSTTTPYIPHGNLKCERFNWALHDLFKMLPKSQKPNWPAHLSSLGFAYNAMPNSTQLQDCSNQLMFGCKVQTPCKIGWAWTTVIQMSLYPRPLCCKNIISWCRTRISIHWRALKRVQNRVLSEQEVKNCPSWRVILSYCRIIPKVVIWSKTILKIKEFVVVKQLCKPNVYHNQLIVSAQSGLQAAVNYKTFKKPMILVTAPVMRKWAIYPTSTLK